MGQRLNLEIVEDDTVLANAYYHWSAYSTSSALLAKKIINIIDDDGFLFEATDVLTAVRLLEQTDAGFNDTEMEWMKDNNFFPDQKFRDAIGRSNGLISVSPEGIEETREWEEGRVSIDLNKKTVSFGVFSAFSVNEFDYINDGEISTKKFPVCPISPLDKMTFVEFNTFCDFLVGMNGYYFKVKEDDFIYGLIA